ncbi:unnamed protein product [Schistosoma margrebowiei]|uniref:Uncharacterized protein n=1 Tax=Schistosoma margrebowiei TaxID=48269 RepID=A0A183LHS9_9TREM|nr:unnamed protein product [Schistosoma margrebowiei]
MDVKIPILGRSTLELGFVLFGTRQQCIPVIFKELMLSDGFDYVSPSFTVRDITTWRIESSREQQLFQDYRYTLLTGTK